MAAGMIRYVPIIASHTYPTYIDIEAGVIHINTTNSLLEMNVCNTVGSHISVVYHSKSSAGNSVPKCSCRNVNIVNGVITFPPDALRALGR